MARKVIPNRVDHQGHHLIPGPQKQAHRNVPNVFFRIPAELAPRWDITTVNKATNSVFRKRPYPSYACIVRGANHYLAIHAADHFISGFPLQLNSTIDEDSTPTAGPWGTSRCTGQRGLQHGDHVYLLEQRRPLHRQQEPCFPTSNRH